MQRSTMNYPCFQTIILLFTILIGHSLNAQNTVHPGDANNNGQVEKTDFLYIGYAYNATGPSRIDQSTSFSEIEIPQLWDEFFEDGNDTNFAFADCDGNGWVSWQDLLVGISNYSENTGDITPVEFLSGDPAIHPQIKFNYISNPNELYPGSTLTFPIRIATPEDPIENIVGFSFSLVYDKTIIKDVRLDFHPNSWLTADGNTFLFQDEPFGIDGVLDAASVRYGQTNAITGGGVFGEVSLIIEDNLVGLLPGDSTQTSLYVTDISMIGDDFSNQLVASDSLKLKVYNIDAITNVVQPSLEEQIKVYPNPTDEHIFISSNIEIQSVEILDLLGKQVAFYPQNNQYQTKISLTEDQTNNVYIAKINTVKGVLSKRVVRKPR